MSVCVWVVYHLVELLQKRNHPKIKTSAVFCRIYLQNICLSIITLMFEFDNSVIFKYTIQAHSFKVSVWCTWANPLLDQVSRACAELCPLRLRKTERYDLWCFLNNTWQDSCTGFWGFRTETNLKTHSTYTTIMSWWLKASFGQKWQRNQQPSLWKIYFVNNPQAHYYA